MGQAVLDLQLLSRIGYQSDALLERLGRLLPVALPLVKIGQMAPSQPVAPVDIQNLLTGGDGRAEIRHAIPVDSGQLEQELLLLLLAAHQIELLAVDAHQLHAPSGRSLQALQGVQGRHVLIVLLENPLVDLDGFGAVGELGFVNPGQVLHYFQQRLALEIARVDGCPQGRSQLLVSSGLFAELEHRLEHLLLARIGGQRPQAGVEGLHEIFALLPVDLDDALQKLGALFLHPRVMQLDLQAAHQPAVLPGLVVGLHQRGRGGKVVFVQSQYLLVQEAGSLGIFEVFRGYPGNLQEDIGPLLGIGLPIGQGAQHLDHFGPLALFLIVLDQ